MGFAVLSDHVRIEDGEEKRIAAAVEALKADPHAPREITVTLILSVYREYPKHIVIGKDEAGSDVVVVVNTAEEEAAARGNGQTSSETSLAAETEPDQGREVISDKEPAPAAEPAPAEVEVAAEPAPAEVEVAAEPAPAEVEVAAEPAPAEVEVAAEPAPADTEADDADTIQ